jgi:hypothetical protein
VHAPSPPCCLVQLVSLRSSVDGEDWTTHLSATDFRMLLEGCAAANRPLDIVQLLRDVRRCGGHLDRAVLEPPGGAAAAAAGNASLSSLTSWLQPKIEELRSSSNRVIDGAQSSPVATAGPSYAPVQCRCCTVPMLVVTGACKHPLHDWMIGHQAVDDVATTVTHPFVILLSTHTS